MFATTPMWARLFLLISDGVDVDMHDLRVLHELVELARHAVVETAHRTRGADRSQRPRSSRRRLPCIPSMCSDCGSSPGNPPRPITVMATGMLTFFANLVYSAEASD